MQTVKFGKKSVSIYYKDPKLMKLDDYASLKLFAKENPGADLEEARKALEEFSKARALEKAKDQTSAVDSKKKEATKKAPAKPVLKGISIKEPIHSTQSNRPITRSRTAETLDKGKGKVVVEKEVPKKTLVTIADSTKGQSFSLKTMNKKPLSLPERGGQLQIQFLMHKFSKKHQSSSLNHYQLVLQDLSLVLQVKLRKLRNARQIMIKASLFKSFIQ